MMTFSEALSQAKAGADIRWVDWPRRDFVRAVVVNGTPEARRYPVGAPYTPTQAELFGQEWTLA